jgi:Ni2+-binding GTPase involved in maturation of urease and hydrogenase
MKKHVVCPTILDDEPSEEDFLGGHERVAQAIYNLITTEPIGKTIGLEGTWGSGKSTVIKLLKAKLLKLNKRNIEVFTFDAWAHEGDPLRRTFLEKLIVKLLNTGEVGREKWLNKTKWDTKLATLGGIASEEKSTSSPRITKLGKKLIKLSFFIPFGAAMFSTGLKGIIDNSPTSFYNIYTLLFFLGIFISVLPLIIVIIEAGFYAKKNKGKKLDEVWIIFVQKVISKSTIKTVTTPNPTSVEFEHYFNDLVNESINKTRKLIIILDNLDRGSSENALSILSTLQVFMQHDDVPYSSNNEPIDSDKFNRIWIIIPYDKKALGKVLVDDTPFIYPAGSQPSSDKNINFYAAYESACSLLEKRFQITFTVPPPILSNWKDYFLKCLKIAFPDSNHSDDEFLSIYKIYHKHLKINNELPTPRKIKVFINHIGSIHRQWPSDVISLVHVAYYVYLNHKYDDMNSLITEVTTGNIPETDIKYLLKGNVLDDIAMLIFNVQNDEARQLLWENPIIEALTNNSPDRLVSLHSINEKGFWAVFEEINFKEWIDSSPSRVAKAMKCIDQTTFFSDQANPYIESIKAVFQDALLLINHWDYFSLDVAEGIIIGLKFNNNAQLAKSIFSSFSNLLEISSPAYQNTEQKADEIVASLYLLINYLFETYQDEIKEFDSISFSFDPSIFIEFCSSIYKIDIKKEHWSIFGYNGKNDELPKIIKSWVENGTFSGRHLGAIKVFNHILKKVSWGDVFQSAINELKKENPRNICELLELLWIFRSINETLDNNLSPFVINDSFILNDFEKAYSTNDYRGSAWALFIYLYYKKELNQTSQIFLSADGFKHITEIMTHPSSYEEIKPYLIDILADYQQLEQFINLSTNNLVIINYIKELIIFANKSKIDLDYYYSIVINNWKSIETLFENEKTIDDYIVGLTNLELFISKLSLNNLSATYFRLYGALLRHDFQTKGIFLQWLLTNIKLLSKEKWVDGIKRNDDLSDLILLIISNGGKLELSQDLLGAISILSSDIAEGKTLPTKTKQMVQSLLSTFLGEARKRIIEELHSIMINTENVSELFLDYFGEYISDPKIIKSNREIVKKLFTDRFVIKRNVQGLKWLRGILENFPSMLYNYKPKDDFEYMINKLDDSTKANNQDEAQVILESINNLVKPKKQSSK